jgi:hypothetical protein
MRGLPILARLVIRTAYRANTLAPYGTTPLSLLPHHSQPPLQFLHQQRCYYTIQPSQYATGICIDYLEKLQISSSADSLGVELKLPIIRFLLQARVRVPFRAISDDILLLLALNCGQSAAVFVFGRREGGVRGSAREALINVVSARTRYCSVYMDYILLTLFLVLWSALI